MKVSNPACYLHAAWYPVRCGYALQGAIAVELIRHRESYASLFANTVLPMDLASRVPSTYPYGRL